MNFEMIARTIDLFKPEDSLIEVRCFGRTPLSGYFRNKDNLFRCLEKHQDKTWYFVFNKINDACYSREQQEKLIPVKTATTDKDIVSRRWLLIDADPVRATGVSATDEEKLKAKEVTQKMYNYLHNLGFTPPVIADSGNGFHLLYSVFMGLEKENDELAKKVLKTLDMFFSTEDVKVDTSVFNPSRITKLYGTTACKGANTKERPHRESALLHIPHSIVATPTGILSKLANKYPDPKPQSEYQRKYSGKEFDVRDFIAKHGISVKSEGNFAYGTKFVLDECVFDPSHKSPDSAILVRNDGVLCYHCFHDSCADKSWKDVRRLFEPTAYERTFEDRYSLSPRTATHSLDKIMKEDDLPEEAFRSLHEITAPDRSKLVSMPSGFIALDKAMLGFNKGEFSVWSGINGSGKSSVLSHLALNCIDKGFSVAMFSGELRDFRVKEWLHLQAAGKHNVALDASGVRYKASDVASLKIDDWIGDRLRVYLNSYGLKVGEVLKRFEQDFAKHPCDVMIVDNLMSFDTSDIGRDKYENQTAIVLKLSEMAKKYNIHIHFICHPKKSQGVPRKEDISGTSDITNAADNVLMVHRVNRDFENLGATVFGTIEHEHLKKCSNFIEIMKNRDIGIQDVCVPLFFEVESKRFLNFNAENIVFGWDKRSLVEVAGYIDEDPTLPF